MCLFEYSSQARKNAPFETGIPAWPNGLRIEFPSVRATEEYAAAFPNARHWRFFQRHQKRGAVAACVWEGQTLVYRSIAICGPTNILACGFGTIRVPESSYYVCHCETHPEYRGRSIYPAMLRVLATRLVRDKLARRVLIATDLENVASQRGAVKAGFTLDRIAVRCTLLGAYIPISLHTAQFAPHHFHTDDARGTPPLEAVDTRASSTDDAA